MSAYVIRQVAGAVAALGMLGGIAQAQVPERRIRSEQRIPTRKEIPEKPAAPIVVPGKNTVVYETPVITRIVKSEAGAPVVLVERAPSVGGRPNWLPLLGLLGGAALIGTLGSHGGETVTSATPTTPETPTPPVVPPVAPPPPTVVPEPATLALLATGLAGLGMARRRRRARA